MSLWLSVDPLAEYNPFYNDQAYIDGEHNGGIYNPGNLNPYIYTYNSPVIYVDPNGKQNYSVILGNLKKIATHSTAAVLGAEHAVASAFSLGLGDLLNLTEPPKGMPKEYLISYYVGRAIADIGMINTGGNIAASGGTVAATTGLETVGVGAVAGGGTAAYGGGVALAGVVDLKQSLTMLMSLGINPEEYENPGHHDAYPKQKKPNNYNPKKSVLPEDHVELFEKSVMDPKKSDTRWTKVMERTKAIYHRFQSDGNGKWHWNGSTVGKTKSGADRKIDLKNVPQEIKNKK
ncbi:hypothetical protein CRH01_22880 [Chryseobacterium rhizosphaerae]|nr:hypothetical protein CRH01_22880 [Chryseobacterium rhizosphaerae]